MVSRKTHPSSSLAVLGIVMLVALTNAACAPRDADFLNSVSYESGVSKEQAQSRVILSLED